MPLVVDERMAVTCSRLSLVRMAMFMLRSMENWRAAVNDCDKVMILLAVLTIGGERFTRGEGLEESLRDIRNRIPDEQLMRCNISSVAAATGFNRETTRRKINELVDAGVLQRTPTGRLGFRAEFFEGTDPVVLVRRELESLVRLVNDLMRDGVVKTG